MATPRHTIELNGQLYDAVTGTPVQSSGKTPTPQVMDGFTKRKAADAPAVTVAAVPGPAPKKHRVMVQAAKPAPKPVQKSATLMRTVVKKPQSSAVQPSKPQLKKAPHHNPHRQFRADAVSRSQKISKFGNVHGTVLKSEVAEVPLKTPPVMAAAPPLNLRQQIAAVTGNSFERALQQADSHKQPKIKKARAHHRVAKRLQVAPRTVSLASGMAAALIIAGFFLYQNIPNLSMRVASAKAGVSADLPGYRPAGYSMSRKIQYSRGQITVSFRSHSDERAFNLTQQKTDWKPQQLEADLVANKHTYQTYQDKGKTIYMYDDGNAAWLEEDILYRIDGNASLNSDQLIRLATSI